MVEVEEEEVDMIIMGRMVANKVKEAVILVTTISMETPTALTVTPISMDILLIPVTKTPIIKTTPLKLLTPAMMSLKLIIMITMDNLPAQDKVKSASFFSKGRASTVQTVALSTFKHTSR